ncbi:hypothetical protein CRUP_023006, partial [Coryphaenoides rupestris]
MFQVVHAEKPLYVQAGNCVEACEWMEVLSQVSRCNERRLAHFHPSTYSASAWQCCKGQSDRAPGCKPCTTPTPATLQLDIDCDRETERIFSSSHPTTASSRIWRGPQREQDEYSKFTIQDPRRRSDAEAAAPVMEELQAQHSSRSDPTAQYGS